VEYSHIDAAQGFREALFNVAGVSIVVGVEHDFLATNGDEWYERNPRNRYIGRLFKGRA
jgi:hypothetical protein